MIKRKQAQLAMAKPDADFLSTKSAFDYYTKILELLKNDDIESLIATFNNSIATEESLKFNKHILSTPAKEIAEEYVNLTKSLMIDNGAYSDEKFEELKTAFYKGNENLKSSNKKLEEYEEEPENNNFSNHLTEDMKVSLDTLNKMLRKSNPKSMSPEEFKDFSAKFKDLTKKLAISKFQQYFDEKNQTIKDMDISYDTDDYSRTVYKTDFTLSDASSQESHLTLKESAPKSGFISSYYQNLCFSYLEADKYSKIDKNLLNTDIISNEMYSFTECYKKLEEMMSKCKIAISNHSLFYLSESEIEPTELDYDLEACNNEPINPPQNDGNEIQI